MFCLACSTFRVQAKSQVEAYFGEGGLLSNYTYIQTERAASSFYRSTFGFNYIFQVRPVPHPGIYTNHWMIAIKQRNLPIIKMNFESCNIKDAKRWAD
jgi:hypothetical protein